MTRTIERLEEHPDLGGIRGVLAQLGHITDSDLPRLASAWHNSPSVAKARDIALSPDSPLICDVLAAFDALADLFEEDLLAQADYVTVPRDVTVIALKAVRDAMAAAYARPVLSRRQHDLLSAPWRAVYPTAMVAEPDLGPDSDTVRALLATMPLLSIRCHDARGLALFDELVDRSFAGVSERADAVATTFHAAVLTGRRRLWALVRRTGEEGLGRPCGSCRGSATHLSTPDSARVLGLCLDAACALLVTDAVPDSLTKLLLDPVLSLIPVQPAPGASS